MHERRCQHRRGKRNFERPYVPKSLRSGYEWLREAQREAQLETTDYVQINANRFFQICESSS